MQIERIGLELLVDHPANVNVMDVRLLGKLQSAIASSGRYEPLVVRVHPTRVGCYELINGHHRRKVLAALGHEAAECVVWALTDEEALVLLATINRLQGRDDLGLRAKLLEELREKIGDVELEKVVPERKKQLERVLGLVRLPDIPKVLPEVLEAMTFFVTREQKKIVNGALQKMKGEDRAERLVALVKS